MKDDLISRRAVITAINELMKSPYANTPQFGKERREVMETVKVVCVEEIPTVCEISDLVE